MTKQQQEFDYYCLDRIKPITEEFTITYNDGFIIRKILYKLGLRTKIKRIDSFVLYTESDDDLEGFKFIPTDIFYDYYEKFFTDVLTIDELKSIVKNINTINIFEYTSLLEFTNIYDDFKKFIEYNWQALDMDGLIEI
jgi:hypothetical protein